MKHYSLSLILSTLVLVGLSGCNSTNATTSSSTTSSSSSSSVSSSSSSSGTTTTLNAYSVLGNQIISEPYNGLKSVSLEFDCGGKFTERITWHDSNTTYIELTGSTYTITQNENGTDILEYIGTNDDGTKITSAITLDSQKNIVVNQSYFDRSDNIYMVKEFEKMQSCSANEESSSTSSSSSVTATQSSSSQNSSSVATMCTPYPEVGSYCSLPFTTPTKGAIEQMKIDVYVEDNASNAVSLYFYTDQATRYTFGSSIDTYYKGYLYTTNQLVLSPKDRDALNTSGPQQVSIESQSDSFEVGQIVKVNGIEYLVASITAQ